MNILVIGNGAREHTMVWKIAQSPKVKKIFTAPGNAGTAAISQNLNIPASDIPALVKAAQEHKIDLVAVGPEDPLTKGIIDELQKVGIPAFGPSAGAAQIEGSKVFAKELMFKYGVPCAKSATFDAFDAAVDYARQQSHPLVIKADGLAAGKGVIISGTEAESIEALSQIIQQRAFGDAGKRVLVEECLVGREASLLVFTDGQTVIDMIPACDYKRALDGNQGLNTGGMGCYSPSEFFGPELKSEAIEKIIKPTIEAMAKEGYPYKGVLYAGLMMTSEGPKVLEFNARFGDPETQVILPQLESDLVEVMQATINGELSQQRIKWSDQACVGVVMASGGYPQKYRTGMPIRGLDKVNKDVEVFHAGTKKDASGNIVTDGGRVLTVVAKGADYQEARSKAYRNVSRIKFEGCHYRTDIADINA